VEPFLNLSLKALQLDYVDLYLIHNPVSLKTAENGVDIAFKGDEVVLDLSTSLEEVWKAMEAQFKAGKARAIGVSNYSVSQLERIIKCAKVMPANHQASHICICIIPITDHRSLICPFPIPRFLMPLKLDERL
jgi:diketogulonate reductase-like aldo/keto reductase